MEILDIVNEHDIVVGQASKAEIYAQKLPHRIAHVILFNTAGDMALQLRSATVSYCPLHWVTTAGGHVDTGETYEVAAQREMQEEIGVDVPLTFLSKDVYHNPTIPGFYKMITCFRATYDGPMACNPDEVERIAYFSLPTIKSMIANGEPFHPELLFLLKKYFS